MLVGGSHRTVSTGSRGPRAHKYVYHPETFEILAEPGQFIASSKVQSLRRLGLYHVATGRSSRVARLLTPPGFQPQSWGKKKRAIACARMTPGNGGFQVNGEPLDTYLPTDGRQDIALEPFRLQGLDPEAFTVEAYVAGGSREKGVRQPRAIAHAIAGALALADDSRRLPLIRAGFRIQLDPPKWVSEHDR